MLQRFCDMLALLLFIGEDLKQSQSTSEFQTVVLSGVNFLLASFALQGSRRQDYRLCTSLLLARGALHSATESHTTRRSWLRKIS